MGLVTSHIRAPPLATEAAMEAHDPDQRTVTFRPSGTMATTDHARPMLFVCANSVQDSYEERGPMHRLADTLQTTVVYWEWPEHGVRRKRVAGHDGQWQITQAKPSAIKADVLQAFADTAALARAKKVPSFYLLGRAFGTGPAMHVLKHAAAEDRVLLKGACLVSPFTSFLDLAWAFRPTSLAWPLSKYRNSGPETFDNIANSLGIESAHKILLVHGKQDDVFPPSGAEQLEMALKDAHLIMRPDWDHHMPWDVLTNGELKRWLSEH